MSKRKTKKKNTTANEEAVWLCAEREREKYGTKYARKLGEEFANKELSTEHSTISKQF